MKIVTDFDGTLTQIQGEYESLLEIIDKQLENKGFPLDTYKQLFLLAIQKIQKEYTLYGWLDHDRITAYSDEDLFMNIIAGMKIVDTWLQNRLEYTDLQHILDNQKTSLMEISEDCYFILNKMPLCPMNTPVENAVNTIHTLLNHGHQVVVVSNSPSTRIIQKLEFVGLSAVDHDIDPTAQLKVIGNAAKYCLSDPPRISTYIRPVDTNRPVYQKILLDETPDIVIGDVFSLDLSLPCYLNQINPNFANIRNILLQQSYTPEWALSAIKQHPSGAVIHHFSDLLSFTD